MDSVYHNILQTIGNTPVMPLKHMVTDGQAEIFGKYEAGNPTYSLKDRIAFAIIEDLERSNRIHKNSAIVVASNGNTGISMAMVCAVRGYKLHLFMSNAVTQEKRLIPKTFGAEVHLVECDHLFYRVVDSAKDFVKKTTDSVYIDQFDCEPVVKIHAETTAIEIIQDFPDGVDAFVMGIGTGGTLTGVAQVLKSKFSKTKIYAVEPEASSVLSGHKPGPTKIQQIGLGFVPENLDQKLIDEIIMVSDQEAMQTTQLLAKKEGLLLGISSGANVAAALKVATVLGKGKIVLTVFCDQGQRYFSLENL